MWTEITYWLPALPAIILIRSDWRRRSVAAGWLTVFGASVLLGSAVALPGSVLLRNTELNILLLGYLSGGIVLYLRIRRGCWIDPLKEHVGLGDLLFLLLLTPAFGLREYLLLTLSALSAALILWSVYAVVSKRRPSIPLISVLGAAFIVHLLLTRLLR